MFIFFAIFAVSIVWLVIAVPIIDDEMEEINDILYQEEDLTISEVIRLNLRILYLCALTGPILVLLFIFSLIIEIMIWLFNLLFNIEIEIEITKKDDTNNDTKSS